MVFRSTHHWRTLTALVHRSARSYLYSCTAHNYPPVLLALPHCLPRGAAVDTRASLDRQYRAQLFGLTVVVLAVLVGERCEGRSWRDRERRGTNSRQLPAVSSLLRHRRYIAYIFKTAEVDLRATYLNPVDYIATYGVVLLKRDMALALRANDIICFETRRVIYNYYATRKGWDVKSHWRVVSMLMRNI